MKLALSVPLDRFDLQIETELRAHVTGIFGPSGSGKTTLLETIAGLRKGAQGHLTMAGTDWQNSSRRIFYKPEQRGIGYVPQEHLLFPHRSVKQNLLAGTKRARAQGTDVEATLEQVVTMLELKPLLERPVSTLSGGERQRVSLGRALCSGPRLLLLDEPLSALDSKLRHRILPFLLRVREEFKAPILVVSHQPLELQTLCDEVIAIHDGRIVDRGTPVEVFTGSQVYANIADSGFENILPATVVGTTGHLCRLSLGDSDSGPEIQALLKDYHYGQKVTIGLRAYDILVSNLPVTGLSARNQLTAQIRQIDTVANRVILKADAEGATGAPPIAVEITPDSVSELGLKKGLQIQLIFKSSAVTIYG